MNTDPAKSYLVEYLIAAGYILFFCLAVVLFYLFLFLTIYSEPKSAPINTFATSLPPVTPTPHVLPADRQNAPQIFMDDFKDDSHGWTKAITTRKQDVEDGRLLFESLKEDYYAFTGCTYCPEINQPFYMQADLSTDKATDEDFGILFNLNYPSDSFYLFQINTEAGKYYLYRHNNDGWSLRAAGETDQIKAFPAVNTLGIYADKDFVELYVNGNIVDAYRQTGFVFYGGYFSFYVDNQGFKLIVDNLIIKDMKRQ